MEVKLHQVVVVFLYLCMQHRGQAGLSCTCTTLAHKKPESVRLKARAHMVACQGMAWHGKDNDKDKSVVEHACAEVV